MKLCVFAGSTLQALYDKGEIKERYYNPCDLFNEVNFISFANEEIKEEKIKEIAGSAEIKIHAVGKLTPFNMFSMRKRVLKVLREIRPDVIRAYTPAVQGYYAAYCAKALSVPLVVSLHTNFDDMRRVYYETGQWVYLIKAFFSKLFTEKYVLTQADAVICVYSFILPYAWKYGARNPVVIYNKVFASQFKNAKPLQTDCNSLVICIGRLVPEKDPSELIRSMKCVNAQLSLIGNGSLYPELVRLAEKESVKGKVFFLKNVPNSHLPSYFKSAKVLVSTLKVGGVAIPVIEAMAADVPVIVTRVACDSSPELASEVGLVVENEPKALAEAINRVLTDDDFSKRLREKGVNKFVEIEGLKMEEKEKLLYEKVFEGK